MGPCSIQRQSETACSSCGAGPVCTGQGAAGACEGILAISQAWPSTIRTVQGDHKRFQETYFSTFSVRIDHPLLPHNPVCSLSQHVRWTEHHPPACLPATNTCHAARPRHAAGLPEGCCLCILRQQPPYLLYICQGFYFTGDGARRDARGMITITGRVDDVINVSGHRVGTAEVEAALASHGACIEAAVVGYACGTDAPWHVHACTLTGILI